MATIESRITLLERTKSAAMRTHPLPFYVLPAEGDTRRADIQANIAAHKKTGQRFITYEIVR